MIIFLTTELGITPGSTGFTGSPDAWKLITPEIGWQENVCAAPSNSAKPSQRAEITLKPKKTLPLRLEQEINKVFIKRT